MTFWAAGHNGNDIMSGVYRLNKTGGTGTGNTWSNGLIPGFCIEIQEPHPTSTYTYDVKMPEDVYNNYTGQYLGTTKANYLRELWALHYDPAWASARRPRSRTTTRRRLPRRFGRSSTRRCPCRRRSGM